MKKYTFEELIKNYETNPNYQLDLLKNDCYNDTLNLLKQVREATLQECAKKSGWYFNGDMDYLFHYAEDIHVNRHEILDLDKDSIEVDE